MRKFKLNLNKSKRKNSGKTWDTPSFVFFDSMSYRIYENDIIIIFDFIKYKMEFSIYEASLFDNFLNELHSIFGDFSDESGLGDAINQLSVIRQKKMFSFDEKTCTFTLDLEIAKELGEVKRIINHVLHGIKIFLFFNKNTSGKSFLMIDKMNTENNMKNIKN